MHRVTRPCVCVCVCVCMCMYVCVCVCVCVCVWLNRMPLDSKQALTIANTTKMLRIASFTSCRVRTTARPSHLSLHHLYPAPHTRYTVVGYMCVYHVSLLTYQISGKSKQRPTGTKKVVASATKVLRKW